MQKMKVERPFSVRLKGEAELMAFPVGVHEVGKDVLAHWFVQACLQDGRAVLLGEVASTTMPDAGEKQEKSDQKAQKRSRTTQEQE